MRKSILTLLVLACASAAGMAQAAYADYSGDNRQVVFFDNFNNNQNHWWVDSNAEASALIENGTYQLEWRGSSPIWNDWLGISMDLSRDFEMEARIKQTSGSLDNLFGLVFNQSDKGSCGFVINGKGASVVYQDRTNQDRRFIKSGGDQVPGITVFPNDYNKLTIRHIKGRDYFYVNEKLLAEGDVVDFSSALVGFQLWYHSSIDVDYLRVSYLMPSAKAPLVADNTPCSASDVDENIPVTKVNNDKTFAVVIGNEVYAKEIRVNFAQNDASVFKQYLIRTLGLPETNIQYLENATYGQMLDAIKWIGDVMKVYNGEAKVIFYYAGHGMPDEQSHSAYLLPVDGNSQNPATAVKLTDLYAKLEENPATSVTVFLDACFSGAAREATVTMMAQGRGVKIRPRSDVVSGNMVVFSAATGDETALPYTEKQHGLFTYYLLKGLKDTEGMATLGELSQLVITNVSRQAVVVNHKPQTPLVNASTQMQNVWQTMRLR